VTHQEKANFYIVMECVAIYIGRTFNLWLLLVKVILLVDFSFVKIFLKNYRVTMKTISNTSCSENTMVLSEGEGFCMHACIF
jgi:ABC-type transport system involved in Fe-S cluster assembly fused permease/ATPase subunit